MPKVSDADFIQLVETHGPTKAAGKMGLNVRGVFERRARLEAKLGRQIKAPDYQGVNTRHAIHHPNWLTLDLPNGIALAGGDAHYWPNRISTAHRAFCHFAKELQPKAIFDTGDSVDGAQISRHAPIGWENRPTVEAELEATKERKLEVERAAPNAKRYWCLGNHDSRFETRLATVAPEYARIHGFHLKDHMPYWRPCWAVLVNDDVVIKHRLKGGVHATHNNTLSSGKSIFTGHLHSLKVTPYSDYNGTRFGGDCGTLADPYGPQFEDYTEQSPLNWRSGFLVLTFHKGKLLWPEVVHVIGEGEVEFRGKVIRV